MAFSAVCNSPWGYQKLLTGHTDAVALSNPRIEAPCKPRTMSLDENMNVKMLRQELAELADHVRKYWHESGVPDSSAAAVQ